jgi:hypothetical protein
MKKEVQTHASANTVYGMGLIGSLVYFISTACSFWMGLWGVVKAIFWPAFLVYEAFKYLGA